MKPETKMFLVHILRKKLTAPALQNAIETKPYPQAAFDTTFEQKEILVKKGAVVVRILNYGDLLLSGQQTEYVIAAIFSLIKQLPSYDLFLHRRYEVGVEVLVIKPGDLREEPNRRKTCTTR